MKKIIAILLVCMMALSLLPVMASADEETWTWTLEDGVLTITGTGDVGDPKNGQQEDYPWNDQRADIVEVVVSDGITSLGKNSFCHCDNMVKVTLGKDCVKLSMDAFAYNASLETLVFNGKIEEMGQGVVYASNAIAYVTLNGQTEDQFKAIAAAKPYNVAINGGIASGLDSASYTIENPPSDTSVPVVVTAVYKKIENFKNKTYFLVGVSGYDTKEVTRSIRAEEGVYTLQYVVKDETTGQTYTISKYAITELKVETYSDGSFFRLPVCDYGIVPVVDHEYTVSITILKDGVVACKGTSAAGAFLSENESYIADGPIIPETINVYYDEYGQDPVDPPTPPAVVTKEIDVVPMFGVVENWNGGTFLIAQMDGMANKDYSNLKDGKTSLKVVITETNSGKVYTISKYAFDTPNKEVYITDSMCFLRFAVCEYGIVPTTEDAFTVAVEVTNDKGEVLFKGTSAAGAFNKFNDAFKADGAIVPDEVTHYYDEYVPGEDTTTTKKVVVYYPAGELVLTATATGNKLTGVAATAADGKVVVDDDSYAVLTMTVSADGTFTLQTADGKYLTAGATGNALTLEADKSDLAVWVMDGEFIKNTTASYNGNPQYLEYYYGFTTYGKADTAKPEIYTFELVDAANVSVKSVEPPVGPTEVTVSPLFGVVENWGGKTYMIAGIDMDAEVYNALESGEYSLKVVLTETNSGKVYTISKYAFDTPSGEFYITDNLNFLRLAVCEYGIVPTTEDAYTVAIEVTDANGAVVVKGTSAEGAFDSYNEAFQDDGAIVPDEVTHYYDEYAPVVPPQTGDATVVLAVVALVALFGAAVVVTKKVTER